MGAVTAIKRLFGRREAKSDQPDFQGYRGGEIRRTNSDWRPQPIGPNAEADMTLDMLRRRVTWLIDNNPLLNGVCETMANNVIGTGIRAAPATEWDDLNDTLRAFMDDVDEGVDVNRCESLTENQRSAFRELFRGGEFGRHGVIAPAHRGYARGPAIEIIPAEFMPLEHTLPNSTPNRLRHSVEFNSAGQAVAYHVLKDDPNDGSLFMTSNPLDFRRISANDMDLVFRTRRRGQVRGVPWPVAIVDTSRMEEQFHEAYILLARIAACVGAWIKGLPNTKLMADGQVIDARTGQAITRLEPGMIGLLPQNADVVINGTNVPPPAFAETIKGMGRRMSSGMNLSYSVVARDFSEATFSSNRAEQLEDRKSYRPVQRILWHRHTLPWWRGRIAWAIKTGEITLRPNQRAVWVVDPDRILKLKPIYPGWEWVDPAKQANAAKVEVEMGFKSVPEIIEERGGDWREVVRQQLEFEKYEMEQREAAGLSPRQPPAADDAPGGGDTEDDREDKDDSEDDDTDGTRAQRLAVMGIDGHKTHGSDNGTSRRIP